MTYRPPRKGTSPKPRSPKPSVREKASKGRFRAYLTALRVALFTAAMLLLASYLSARHTARALVLKSPEQWHPYSARFEPIRSLSGRLGPCWQFSFIPSDQFLDGPLTLEITLTGKAFASDPADALARLQELH
jgi:hypothetical protein